MDGDARALDSRAAVLAAVLAAAAAVLAWVAALHRMRGMDMGPGMDLGSVSFLPRPG
jgi:hypothetical protein